MADPKVVHPATQNWIDFRNHSLDGPADMLSEDFPEPFKQRGPLLQLGRIVGPPLPPISLSVGLSLPFLAIDFPSPSFYRGHTKRYSMWN
jgi:hypothetical protein